MDYKQMLTTLVEQIGKEKMSIIIGKIIVERECPHSFGLSDVEDCGTYPQNCTDCWTEVLGLNG